MSFGATKLLAASGGKAYEIDQSLLFDSGDSADLTKTMGAGGNRKTYTISMWLKRTKLGVRQAFIYGGSDNENYTTYADFSANDELDFVFYSTGSGVLGRLKTNRVFRDIANWYHVVLAMDTTESTAGDRMRMYINGVEQTSFSVDTNPSLDSSTHFLNEGFAHYIGNDDVDGYFDGLIAEVNVVDGSQLTPSSFGETDTATNAWIPKKYVGAYGTQGFYLKFVSGALGTDSSGEGNNWTANNVGNGDVLLDTPTNNFPIVNILEPVNTTISTFRQGTLNIKASAYSSGNYGNNFASFILPTSGKWYVEMLTGIQAGSGNVAQLGISKQGPDGLVIPNQSQLVTTFSGTTGLNISLYADTADLYDGGSSLDQDTGLTATSYVCALAVDIDNDKVWVGYDGGSSITWLNSGNPATGANGAAHTFDSDSGIYMAVATSSDNANRSYVIMNFGQNGTFSNYKTAGGNADGAGIGNFFYSPPSGFKALCQKNLPTPAIKLPGSHFNPVIYTGSDNDAVSQSVTGVGFEPDLVIIKKRNASASPAWWDQVRGEHKGLNSDGTQAEVTDTYGLETFDSDGFTVRESTSAHGQVNTGSLVAWNWLAGGTAPSKTYTTKVVSDSGNKYRFDDYGTSAVTLNLQEGGTYTFDQSDSSNSGHPLRFSTTSDGSHGGGSEYTTGVTTNGTPGSSGAYTRITVAASAATLYYYCTAHSGMGGQANTNSTHGSTNLNGSILSVVSENTTSGFSVVSYTGTGSNATVGHGLGVAPLLIIVKNRSQADKWVIYSTVTDETDYLQFDRDTSTVDDNTMWNDTAPTSSVFSVGTAHEANASSENYIAYCFAEKDGFSKIGAYRGNGSTNGPYIYTRFQPSFVVWKRTNDVGRWQILDVARDTTNVVGNAMTTGINWNSSSQEYTGWLVDFYSNGFKPKQTEVETNANASTFLYMAFSEFPDKYSNAK
jgi:hypothetical protein